MNRAAEGFGGLQTIDKPIFYVWGCMKAVSYTHLDVYKRQVLLNAGMGKWDEETGEWSPTSQDVYAFDAEVMDIERMYTHFLRGVQALVSYTHLDVYKRQEKKSEKIEFFSEMPFQGRFSGV